MMEKFLFGIMFLLMSSSVCASVLFVDDASGVNVSGVWHGSVGVVAQYCGGNVQVSLSPPDGYHDGYVNHTYSLVNNQRNITLSGWVYDNGGQGEAELVGGLYAHQNTLLGWNEAWSSTEYVYAMPHTMTMSTNISRYLGWHLFEIYLTPNVTTQFWIDNQLVVEVVGDVPDTAQIALVVKLNNTNRTNTWHDVMVYEGAPIHNITIPAIPSLCSIPVWTPEHDDHPAQVQGSNPDHTYSGGGGSIQNVTRGLTQEEQQIMQDKVARRSLLTNKNKIIQNVSYPINESHTKNTSFVQAWNNSTSILMTPTLTIINTTTRKIEEAHPPFCSIAFIKWLLQW